MRFPFFVLRKAALGSAFETVFGAVFRQSFGLKMPRLSLAVAYEPADIVQLAVRRGVAMRKLLLVVPDQSLVQLSLPRGQGDVDEIIAGFRSLQGATG